VWWRGRRKWVFPTCAFQRCFIVSAIRVRASLTCFFFRGLSSNLFSPLLVNPTSLPCGNLVEDSLVLYRMAPSLNMDPATAQPYNTARCSPTSSGGTISIYISNSKSIPTPSSTTRSTALSSPKKRRKTAHDQLPPWLRTSICVLAKSIDPLVHTASKQVDWERFNISLLVPSMEGPWDKALRNWPLDRLRGRMKDRHETNGFENLLNAASRLLFREVLINEIVIVICTRG